MKRCFNLIPPRFNDRRHEAIEKGLERHGYYIVRSEPTNATGRDVLTCWNLHAEYVRTAAAHVKAAGGRVIVAEEAYTRRTYPHKHFAIALDGHNGAGRWFFGGPERWDAMGVAVMPWRPSLASSPVYVTEQRGIGSPEMASPSGWHSAMLGDLKRLSPRPVLLRRHLKAFPDQPHVEVQIAGAHALVTWGSSDSARALIAGVPVFYCAPHSIVAGACRQGIAALEAPLMDDAARVEALRRMAWSQWTLVELESGLAFDGLLALPA